MTELPPTREQLRLEGFELIDETLSFLVGCLGDALKSLGEDSLIPYLPWSGTVPESHPPEGTQQLYSIGFQLLNMVEERAAAAIRREREKALGAQSIRGLWPQALRDMSSLGLGPEEILGVLADIDVQPVLTAHPTEAKRASVRERHRALYEELVRNEYPKYTDRERRRIRERIAIARPTAAIVPHAASSTTAARLKFTDSEISSMIAPARLARLNQTLFSCFETLA